jgi:hypothetical protein
MAARRVSTRGRGASAYKTASTGKRGCARTSGRRPRTSGRKGRPDGHFHPKTSFMRSLPVQPPVWLLCPALSSPLFGRSQGYKFAQICITLCPSCIASLKTLSSLLWIHYVRPIVQGGFNFPILDYHDLQDHMHDQFNASTFFSSSI